MADTKTIPSWVAFGVLGVVVVAIFGWLLWDYSALLAEQSMYDDPSLRTETQMVRYTSLIALTGMAGALFGMVSALILWRTLRETQRAANDAQRIGEAQVSAYLSVEDAEVEPIIEDGGVTWRLQYTVVNTGNSPARNGLIEIRGDLFQGKNYKQILADLPSGGRQVVETRLFSESKEINGFTGNQVVFTARLRTH